MPGNQDWANDPVPTEYRQADTRRSGRSPSPNGPPRRERSRSPIRIDSDRPSPRGRPSGDYNPGNNLHVSGISHRVEDSDLQDLFAKYGQVLKAHLMRDPSTKELRGFGFVTMESAQDAEVAISALNGYDLLGKNLCVEKARRGRARTPTPGQYYGPLKRNERRYEPRAGSRYDDRAGGGYDDRAGGGHERRLDDRAPPTGRDDRYGNGRERYDERRDYDRPRRDDRDHDRRW